MKISEIIADLTQMLREHGDVICQTDDEGLYADIAEVSFDEKVGRVNIV